MWVGAAGIALYWACDQPRHEAWTLVTWLSFVLSILQLVAWVLLIGGAERLTRREERWWYPRGQLQLRVPCRVGLCVQLVLVGVGTYAAAFNIQQPSDEAMDRWFIVGSVATLFTMIATLCLLAQLLNRIPCARWARIARTLAGLCGTTGVVWLLWWCGSNSLSAFFAFPASAIFMAVLWAGGVFCLGGVFLFFDAWRKLRKIARRGSAVAAVDEMRD